MKTTSDFERKNPTDNQTQVRLDAGSEILVRNVAGELRQVTANKACTKNGGNKFYVTADELREMTS